ncbi:MAG TPA: alanine--tRNA ligase-related protein, partial [Candidatus Babeliales bacterium]|nr:alanine--tRNA ligase-related protein [Candidatus Babeliales bacterium]
NQATKLISGAEAFKLYDTFGFPLELVTLIANERNFSVDLPAFEQHMEQQREQSGQKSSQVETELTLTADLKTTFLGYQVTALESKIAALFVHNQSTQSAKAGDTVWLVTPETPFFIACGGQVNDQGVIKFGTHSALLLDLKKINHALAIKLVTPVDLVLGQTVELLVDQETRLRTMKNHTATHLLQAALIELLGKSVKQSGSVVNPDYLRFDFTYHKNLTPEELRWVEERVNRKIWENIPVNITYTTHKKAIEQGVIAIFGEKYNPEEVRVIDIPGFSAELCGGTHVRQTGDIGSFKITEISALSAGNRRIFAVTGPVALELYQTNFNDLKELSQEFKVQANEVLETVQKQKDQLRKTQQLLQQARAALWQAQIPTWLATTVNYNTVPYLFLDLNHSEPSELREIANKLMQQKPGLYFLVSQNPETQAVQFIAVLAKNFSTQISLKKLASWLVDNFEIRGGGNELSLQGGGPKLDLNQLKTKLAKALEQKLFVF